MNVTTKYVCPVCQTHHGSEYLADNCCPQEVKSVLVCGECGVWRDWYEKNAAEACCKAKVEAREAAKVATRTCFFCDEPASELDVRDSRLIGSHTRCRVCILRVAPEMVAA